MIIGDLLRNVYVINLDKDKERLVNIQTQFPNVKRIEAVYGKYLPNIAELAKNMKASTNIPATIGCGMSHRKAWQAVIDDGVEYGLILEDDVNVNSSMRGALSTLLPRDWDVVYLGHAKAEWPRNACSRVNAPSYGVKTILNDRWFHFTDVEDVPMGLWAYVVSRRSARYLLDNYQLTEPVDVFMVSQKTLNNLNLYGVNPNLISHCYDYGSYTSRGLEVDLTKRASPMIIACQLVLIGAFLISILALEKQDQRLLLVYIPVLVLFLYYYYKSGDRILHLRRYTRSNKDRENNYINMSGVYGLDAFDPFGNVWTDTDRVLMKNLLKHLMDICKTKRVDCSIAFGSLLGWARHGKQVIPWDDDMDVLIPISFRKELISILEKEQDLILTPFKPGTYDLKISWRNNGHEIPDYEYRYPFVDIFFYETNDSWLEIPVLKKTLKLSSPYSVFVDTFEGVEVNVPIDYDAILSQLYSSDWKSVCVSSCWNHRMEYPVEKPYIKRIKCELL